MSLILLFLPSGAGPTPQNSFTPGVIYAIETLTPTLTFVQTAEGVFSDSTTQYSSSAVTYNSGLYGGADYSRPQLATLNIDTITPVLDTIDKF